MRCTSAEKHIFQYLSGALKDQKEGIIELRSSLGSFKDLLEQQVSFGRQNISSGRQQSWIL
jgi:hypothetical protein